MEGTENVYNGGVRDKSQPSISDGLVDASAGEVEVLEDQVARCVTPPPNAHAILYSSLPLNSERHEIRLLQIQPSEDNYGPVRATLKVCSLLDNPIYDAFSYTWGEASFKQSILVNGIAIPVTDNLSVAFHRFRYQPLRSCCNGEDPHFLWVDAICIDQTNVLERNHQVQLMSRIYRQADVVVIWLGEGTEDIPTFKSGDAELKHLPWINRFLNAYSMTRPSWFERAWTFQEYVVASHAPIFAFGGYRVPHSILAKGIDWVANRWRFLRLRSVRDSLGWIHCFRTAYQEGRCSLSLVLSHTDDLDATDPRDLVYGLLGIVCPTPYAGLKPDYTLSLHEVLARSTLALLMESKDFSPFLGKEEIPALPFRPRGWSKRVQHMQNAMSDKIHLPSWVSRTLILLDTWPCIRSGRGIAHDIIRTDPTLPWHAPSLALDGTLRLSCRGWYVDEITEILHTERRHNKIYSDEEMTRFVTRKGITGTLHRRTVKERQLYPYWSPKLPPPPRLRFTRPVKADAADTSDDAPTIEEEVFVTMEIRPPADPNHLTEPILFNEDLRIGDEIVLFDNVSGPVILRPDPAGWLYIGPPYNLSLGKVSLSDLCEKEYILA